MRSSPPDLDHREKSDTTGVEEGAGGSEFVDYTIALVGTPNGKVDFLTNCGQLLMAYVKEIQDQQADML